MARPFYKQKTKSTPAVFMLLWAFTIFWQQDAIAQNTSSFAVNDYRTSSSGSLGQAQGTANLEIFTSDNTWVPASYPLPVNASLHIHHAIQIEEGVQLKSLTINQNQSVTVRSSGILRTSEKLVLLPSAGLVQIGLVEPQGLLQLQASAKLIIQSPTYQATSSVWAAEENFAITSEVHIENAAANALLFNPASLTLQPYGYQFGSLRVSLPSIKSDWLLLRESAALANSASFQVGTSGSLVMAGPGTSLAFGTGLAFRSGAFFVQNQTAGTVLLSVDGHLDLQNSILTLNQASSANAVSLLDIKGNLSVDGVSSIVNSSTVSTSSSGIRLLGTTWQNIAVAGQVNHVSIAIKPGALARLQHNLLLNPGNSVYAGTLSVENGASLDFGTDSDGKGYVVAGQGYFRVEQGGRLFVTSAQGINATGPSGNVQVTDSRRTFNQVATFVFNGRTPQHTGNAFTTTSNGKIIIIDNPTSVTLTQSTGITSNTTLSPLGGYLEIKQGRFIGSPTADISSSGRLIMSGGVYQIGMVNTTVPLLTGAYDLTGGAIELAGNGDQILRGKTYLNLIIGGTNVAGATAKTISTTTTIDRNLTVLPNAVLDISNKTLKGDGGLTMTGGLFKIGKGSGTLPELTGRNDGYNLTGGTIEFYGTIAGQTQSIRGTFGNSQKVTYHHLLLNATQANTQNDLGNQLLHANFDVSGTLTVNAPAVLQIASNRAIGGSGNFDLQPGATLLYGSAQGIKLSGTGTSDGNIRVTGTRNFSTQANYGFIGNAEMVTGDGLPATVANLQVAKSGNGVTLSNSVTVKETFALKSGLFRTGTNELALANLSAEAIQLADPSFYIIGNLRRAIGSSGTYSFPVGTVNGKRQFDLNSNGLAGNGFQSIAISFRPLTNHQDTDLQVNENGSRYLDIRNEGVWFVQPNTQPSEGSYTAMASLEGFQNLTDNNFALLIRPLQSTSGKDWKTGGGTLDAPNKDGRTVAGGYVKRNFVAEFGQVGIASMETVLPVSWLYVKAESKNQGVQIQWATASEKDNDRFEVEHSSDGKSFFLAGTLNGQGTTALTHHYTFQHYPSAHKTTYYRVKQVDFDGKFEYSKTVAVKPSVAATPTLSVYPNPSQDVLNLTGLAGSKGLTVIIFDVNGKVVEHLDLSASTNPKIQIKHLPSGTYLLQVKDGDKVQRQRFVKN